MASHSNFTTFITPSQLTIFFKRPSSSTPSPDPTIFLHSSLQSIDFCCPHRDMYPITAQVI
ncbi:hypothetical protein V8C37DRAFT_394147 [Trichoderma ceciliae]